MYFQIPFLITVFFLSVSSVFSHHGVAATGVSGLVGPGAPLETSSSSTLPKGKTLIYIKSDHVRFEKDRLPVTDEESDSATYQMFGVGYGFRPWFSAYAFLPYNSKMDEYGSGTSGFTDLSLMGVYAFKYDEKLMRLPQNESLDDQKDWHFTVFAGTSIPTGREGLRDATGTLIDPGKQLSFGEPSFSLGLSATKQLNSRFTWVNEISSIWFQDHDFTAGLNVKYGTENRINTALVKRVRTDAGKKFRLDEMLEFNYLELGRDVENNIAQSATGGKILYLVPGLRYYMDNLSLGIGVKLPIWKSLNEENLQQGAEGTENYRIIFTLSTLF